MDPLLLQKQVRDNANELNSFLNDLKNWEKDMKRKDQELLNSDSDNVAVPPVRSKIKRPKKTDFNNKSPGVEEKRMSSYDYSAWDKFDVEKACEEVDNMVKKPEPEQLDSESDEESSESNLARLKEQAMYEKELGNRCVKDQRWKDAIDCYTKAIQCNPHDAIFYANRALCFLKTKQPKLAEVDCTTALQLDNSYVKAYQRRALARIEIGFHNDAKTDFLKVLELEPNNSAARSELSKLEKREPVAKQEEENGPKKIVEEKKSREKTISKEKSCTKDTSEETLHQRRMEGVPDMLGAGGDTGTLEVPWSTLHEGDKDILPVQKPPHLRSKRSLRVISVQEVETIADLLEQNAKTENINDKLGRKIVEVQTDSKTISVSDKASEQIARSNMTEPVVKEADVKKSGHQESRELPMPDPHQTTNCKTVDLPPVPKTSMQFFVSWKIVRNNSELKYQFLKQIPGNDLPQIFQESLESREFGEIITSLATEFLERNEPVYPYLRALSEVRRFSALVMFMSKTEKAVIKKLLQHCDANCECSKEDISELLKRYEIK